MIPKLRILVADWNRSVAESLVLVLNLGGFEAVAAFSGEEAIAAASTSAFDVLIADVMMAPLNGIQTANAFRELHPASRVFLFSGNNDASPLLMHTGHNFPVLPKPIHPSELFSHLRSGSLAPSLIPKDAEA